MATFKRKHQFPTNYYFFKAKDKESDEIIEYRIQDLPIDRFEDALNMMVDYFMPYEELNISRELLKSPGGIKEHRELWAEMLERKLSIACFKNDKSNELVGVNILVVNSNDDAEENFNFKDEALSDIISVLDYTAKQVDVYKEFNVTSYLTAYGLVINPAYRGKGIATEMLKARAPLLKELGLNVTTTAFTGIASQIAAHKAGYKEIYSIKYSDLKTHFNFLNTKSEYFKIMALKIC